MDGVKLIEGECVLEIAVVAEIKHGACLFAVVCCVEAKEAMRRVRVRVRIIVIIVIIPIVVVAVIIIVIIVIIIAIIVVVAVII